ncbi:MAG TPA: hypothetical protein PKK12_04885, partial [Candidatus Aminicenantes bacterium]|nr:hypothetical protein [Candidatus Aminicenantes bacterium]
MTRSGTLLNGPKWMWISLSLFLLIAPLRAAEQTLLLRSPDVCGDRLVFTYGGNLWTCSTTGGQATQL